MAALPLTSAAVVNDQHFHKSQPSLSLIYTSQPWLHPHLHGSHVWLHFQNFCTHTRFYSFSMLLKAGHRIMSTVLTVPLLSVWSRALHAWWLTFRKDDTQQSYTWKKYSMNFITSLLRVISGDFCRYKCVTEMFLVEEFNIKHNRKKCLPKIETLIEKAHIIFCSNLLLWLCY